MPVKLPTLLDDCDANARDARTKQAAASELEIKNYYGEVAAMWERMAEAVKKNGLSDIVLPVSRIPN